MDPEHLRQALRSPAAPAAVAAFAALHKRDLLQREDIEAARTHPHWLVRLGYLALLPSAPELVLHERPVGGEGGGMWVEQLAPYLMEGALRDSRALNLTLDQLERLQATLAATGSTDSTRTALARILCALGAHHLRHTIEIDDEIIVTIDEVDIEIDG